jgi:rhamnulokinase
VSHSIKVVAPATHDTGSAVAAVPLGDQHSAYISSGTWSLVGMELQEPLVNEKSLAFNFTNEGGVGGTFRFLRNVMGLWLVTSCRRAWQNLGREFTHSELIERAAAAGPFKSLIDPDNQRFLSPDYMPDAIQEFCRETDQSEPETEGEFIRCCLESLALKYRWVIERLEEITGRTIRTIHVVGGGAQNRLLNQFTADATGRIVVAGPVEATATGNALVQALGLGYLSSHAELRDIVRNSFELQRFVPQKNREWGSAYQQMLEWL